MALPIPNGSMPNVRSELPQGNNAEDLVVAEVVADAEAGRGEAPNNQVVRISLCYDLLDTPCITPGISA